MSFSLSEMETTLLASYRRALANGEDLKPAQRDAAQELIIKEWLALSHVDRAARLVKARSGLALDLYGR